jgi:hypothetical protein
LDYAVEKCDGDTAIVWLHGGLPYDIREYQDFYQYYRRGGGDAKIFAVSVSGELNALTAKFGIMNHIRSIPSSGDVEGDLEDAIRAARTVVPKAIPERCSWADAPSPGMVWRGLMPVNQNSHAYRLYVFSKAMTELYSQGEISDARVREASHARIVNPAVGAVVLETQADYEKAELDPTVSDQSIPSIPEPGWFWFAIILTIAGTVFILLFRKRAKAAL